MVISLFSCFTFIKNLKTIGTDFFIVNSFITDSEYFVSFNLNFMPSALIWFLFSNICAHFFFHPFYQIPYTTHTSIFKKPFLIMTSSHPTAIKVFPSNHLVCNTLRNKNYFVILHYFNFYSWVFLYVYWFTWHKVVLSTSNKGLSQLQLTQAGLIMIRHPLHIKIWSVNW